MAQPYVGEVRLFAGNFAPAGWMFCSGQLLSIAENETLFQLIGTTYGGDGQNTYGLPNLQSRVPMHFGQGPGLPNYVLAEAAGTETVTLTVPQLPQHNHPEIASLNPGTSQNPTGNILARPTSTRPNLLAYNSDSPVLMNPAAVTSAGGNQPHQNCQPFLCINYIISLFGIFPSPI
jgi:microcystin-dependent protein